MKQKERSMQSFNTLKQLSTNIEKQTDFKKFCSDYFATSQSLFFVNQIASASLAGGGAFSLQGAYGSGKSSLAMFTLSQLSSADQVLPKKLRAGPMASRVQQQGGLLVVPIVASARPLAVSILIGLQRSAKTYKNIKSKALQTCLKLKPNMVDHDQLTSLLISAAKEVKDQKKVGILFMIDEFGRQLEHIVASKVMADLHLLQAIAEMTGIEDSPLTLIIIQHHGLEQYSTNLLSEQKAEWDKVRGRFKEITLSNTETDTANIIARLFPKRSGKLKALAIRKWNSQITLPVLRDQSFKTASEQCAPLHPITIVILSRLAKLLGQNDRTVVGWLTSNMESGFPTIAQQTTEQWIYPACLFTHFFGDVQMIPSNPVLARRCAAIHSVYDRLDDDVATTLMLQTIALLNFCSGGGLGANEATIRACLPSKIDFEKSIKKLEEKSFVIYRKHRQEFFVWEGSDYDLYGRIRATIDHLATDLVSNLNQREDSRFLAHAHLINTGNSRMTDLVWLDADQPVPAPTTDAPRILVWLESMPQKKEARPIDVCGVVNAQGLAGVIHEMAAIQHLLEHDQDLQDDLTAQREIGRLLAFHEQQVVAQIDSILNTENTWSVGRKKFIDLQKALSATMDKTYPKAMILHSDLINRNRVSGQVTSAIRLLIEAMHAHSDKELLGIKKFPAERSIYDSLLLKKKLHVQDAKKGWHLTLDRKIVEPDIAEIIDSLAKHFATSKDDAKPTAITTVVELFSAPPYGLKHTPTLLLCVLFLLLNRDQAELYEDDAYLPKWGPQTLVRMLRSPKSFAISTSTPKIVSVNTLKQYHLAIGSSENVTSPINMARDLLIRYEGLSTYSRQTKTVSKKVDAFRRAINIAKSPGDMLFSTIPSALGFSTFPATDVEIKRYCKAIKNVWSQLESVGDKLISQFTNALLEASGCEKIVKARKKMAQQAKKIRQSNMVYHVHEQFLRAVLDDVDDAEWLKNILNNGLGIRMAIETWSDADAAHAEFLLRHNLLGLRDSAELLSDCIGKNTHSGKKKLAFAVFWMPVEMENEKEQESINELEILVKKIPREKRLKSIMTLAKQQS